MQEEAEAAAAFGMVGTVAQRERQDSANSLDLAARSASLFGASSDSLRRVASLGGLLQRTRTPSAGALRQMAAEPQLLERQVSAVPPKLQ